MFQHLTCASLVQAYFSGSPYASLADTNGFIVIYPSSPHSGTCWDVSSKATLTHNGGGDSNAIANMVTFAINTYKADPSRIFVTGSSSGGTPRQPYLEIAVINSC
jgi:acetylxylan esterase